MPKGVYGRTPEHNASNSRSKRGVPLSPEHCAALSRAKLGVPKPPRTSEHCAAISIATTNSKAAKTESERQRGGDDIVDHHMIYDHSDLTKNVMPMTRSVHTKLHRLFQKHGINIPHINVTGDII